MSRYSSAGSQWNATRLQVLQRDNNTCAYCGNEATEVDHVIPKAKGGTDDMSNLLAACRSCNGSKQDKIEARLNWYNKRWLDRL